jgi:hypothetical protein
MNNRKNFFPPFIGGSSLLVIFAVLCLTLFSLLALSTTQANQRLTNASTQAVSDYYMADQAAEVIFAQLRRGELPNQVTVDDHFYRYKCAISDTQDLQVILSFENNVWTVICWQAISTNQ